MPGRIVRVYDPELVKAFDVAIRDPNAGIAAVRAAHPGLCDCHMQADERTCAPAKSGSSMPHFGGTGCKALIFNFNVRHQARTPHRPRR